MIALTKSISTNEAKKQLPTNSNDELIAELRRTIEDLRRMLSEEKARSDRIDKRNEQLQGELLQRHKEMQAVLEKQTGVSGWLRGILKD
jgi:carbonic anhydrase